MRKILLLSVWFIAHQIGFAQTEEGLIELGKTYRQFMFRNNPPENVLTALDKFANTDLAFVSSFVRETIKPNTQILTDPFLKRPTDADLKSIYIIVKINYNVRKENPADNKQLIESLNKKEISAYELLHNYYSILFTAYGNKVQPFDMSVIDFQVNNYGLKDDTEKGIFFLESMRLNGTLIFGYLNIVKPPRYSEAMKFIDKYPKYNGSPYYQFMDLNFPDFKMNIESDTKPESYKAYYIDKYYETLLSHLACLQDAGEKEKMYDLVLGSILKEEIYYKYSKRGKELKKLLTKHK